MAGMTADRQRRISADIARERPRLWAFVRRRIPDPADAEDVLQDVLAELVESYRLPQPVEQVGAWLFAVARNRIADFFRKKKPEPLGEVFDEADGEAVRIEELLPSRDGGPEAAYARAILVEELDAALSELPAAQRDVFVAHELEGRSFRQIAAATGVPLNTLLARKRYAVQHLRARLQAIHDEFTRTGD